MIQPSVCGEWEKNEKFGHVNKLLKSTSVYKRKKEKKRKRKIIDTTKIRVDIMLEKEKKKVVEKNKSETKYMGLVENRSRPRIGEQVDHLCS